MMFKNVLLLLLAIPVFASPLKEVTFEDKRMFQADTPFFQAVINPLGGRFMSLKYKKNDSELTQSDCGSGTENVWNVSKSRFFLRNKPFSVTADERDEGIVVTTSANHAGGGIDFLKVTKTFTFPSSQALIQIDYDFENMESAMAALPYGFWIQHVLGANGENYTCYYPSEKGIRALSPMNRQKEFNLYSASRGWFGVCAESGKGVAVTMDYPDIILMYSWFSGRKVPTMEWRTSRMNIEAGKSYRTKAEILPFTGLKKISGAGNGLVGELDAPAEVAGNMSFAVTVKVHSAGKETVEAELMVRSMPKGTWQSLGKHPLVFSTPASLQECSFTVPGQKEDTLAELEVILRSETKELARLNGAVPVEDSEVPWIIEPTEQKRVFAGSKVDLLHYNHVYPTEHIPWMKPLPGEKKKALVLVDHTCMPEALNFSQCLDMEFTMPVWQMKGKLKDRSPSMILGDFYGILTPLELTSELKKALKTKYDVILVGGVPWKDFPKDIQKKILDEIKSGTGLVYIGCNAPVPEISPFISAAKNVRMRSLAPSSITESAVTEGIPFDVFQKTSVYAYGKSSGTVLAEADGIPYLVETKIGKGQAYFLNYRANFGRFDDAAGLVPNMPEWMADRSAPYEFYYALIARCMLQASGKLMETSLKASFSGNAGELQIHSQKAEAATLELAVLDPFLEKRAEKKISVALKKGENSVGLPMDLKPFRGKQLLIAFLRNGKGEVLNSGAWSFMLNPEAEIDSCTTDKDYYDCNEPITAEVKLKGKLADVRLNLLYLDSFDRVLMEKTVVPQAEQKITFSIANPLPSRQGRVRALLLAQDGMMLDRRESRMVVRPMPEALRWNDFAVGTWMNNTGLRFHLWKYQAEYMHSLGFNTLIANWDPLCIDYALFGNFEPTLLHHMGLKRCPEPPEYVKTGDKMVLVRKPCLSDEEFLQKTAMSFSKAGKTSREKALRFVWMGDEQSITGYNGTPTDFCFSVHCLKEFRDFLKKRYGTLEKLNQEWNTSFSEWEKVLPFTKDEIWNGHAQSVAGWADHLEFMDGRLENAGKRFFAELRKQDPNARTSISGTQTPTAYGGMDWYRQTTLFDGLMDYPYGGQLEIQRSFKPEGEFMPWDFGYNRKGATPCVRIYRTMFLGLRGTMGFSSYSLMNPDWTLSQPMKDALPHLQKIQSGLGMFRLNLLRQEARVAVLYSQASLRAAFIGKTKLVTGENFVKYNALLRNCGIAFDYISSEQLEQGILEKKTYGYLLLPHCEALSDREVDAIEKFASAGGKVFAEGVPGTRYFNCRERKTPALEKLFHNPEHILLRDFDFSYFETLENSRVAGAQEKLEKEQERMKAFVFGEKLLQLSIDGKPCTDAEIYPLKDRKGNSYYGIMTEKSRMVMLTLRFPEKGFLTELVSGKSYGYGDTVTVPFTNGLPLLMAVQKEKPSSELTLTCSGNRVTVVGNSKNPTVFRFTISGPDGKELNCYAKKDTAEDGKCEYEIPFALSDKKGIYTFRVVDVISHTEVMCAFRR